MLGRSRGQQGDTIVEVLIALAVLSLAFSISYATANRSLLTARNSQEHSTALQYLSSQVELARADVADPGLYVPGQTFCMDPVTGTPAVYLHPPTAPAACVVTTYGTTISGTYTKSTWPVGNVCEGLLTFTAKWQGVGNFGQQEEQMTYKLFRPGVLTC